MAYADTRYAPSNIRQTLARPFVAFGKMLDVLAEAVFMAQAANRILEMSDDTLAAKGVTRTEAIQSLFAQKKHA